MSGLAAVDFFEVADELYGVDDEGLLVDDSSVDVPIMSFRPTEEHQQELQSTIDPLSESSNYGIELYEQTVAFVLAQHPELYSET